METRKLNFINATTSDWHEDVASINEEFVDGNEAEVKKLCSRLISKIQHFKSNLDKDEV